jgi:hypothetical protein
MFASFPAELWLGGDENENATQDAVFVSIDLRGERTNSLLLLHVFYSIPLYTHAALSLLVFVLLDRRRPYCLFCPAALSKCQHSIKLCPILSSFPHISYPFPTLY